MTPSYTHRATQKERIGVLPAQGFYPTGFVCSWGREPGGGGEELQKKKESDGIGCHSDCHPNPKKGKQSDRSVGSNPTGTLFFFFNFFFLQTRKNFVQEIHYFSVAKMRTKCFCCLSVFLPSTVLQSRDIWKPFQQAMPARSAIAF